MGKRTGTIQARRRRTLAWGLWITLVSIGWCHANDPLTESSMILPTALNPGGRFGSAVTAHGELAFVGSPWCQHASAECGGVFVYHLTDASNWTLVGVLLPPDPSDGQLFGASISVSENDIAIGAPGDSTNGSQSGAVYLFPRTSPTTWANSTKITAPAPASNDRFGGSIALRQDRLVVGADGHDAVATDAGTAYLFARVGSTWIFDHQLLPNSLAAFDGFGCAVAASDELVAVGAWLAAGIQPSAGATYTFQEDGAGGWIEGWISPPSLSSGSGFGKALAMSDDWLVIGSPLEAGSGRARVYQHVGGGVWELDATLVPTTPSNGDRFGRALAVEDTTIVVGSWLAEWSGTPDAGSAAVFSRRADGSWSERRRLVATDASVADHLGQAVAIGANFYLAGAPGRDEPTSSNSGSAYVFDRVTNLPFVRGDCTADEQTNIADVLEILQILFVSSTESPCADACDVSDDSAIDLADAIRLLSFQFSPSGPLPEPPFPSCGPDPTLDELGCDGTSGCP